MRYALYYASMYSSLKTPSAAEKKLMGSLIPLEEIHEVLILPIIGKVSIQERIDRDVHLLIVAEEGCEATVCLEVYAEYFDCEVIARDGAHISVVTVQEGSIARIRQRSSVGAGAELHWHNVSLGAELFQELLSEVTGEEGTSSVDWISYLR